MTWSYGTAAFGFFVVNFWSWLIESNLFQSYCSPRTWFEFKDSGAAGGVAPGGDISWSQHQQWLHCRWGMTLLFSVYGALFRLYIQVNTIILFNLFRYQLVLLLRSLALEMEMWLFLLMGCVFKLYLRSKLHLIFVDPLHLEDITVANMFKFCP